MLLKESINSYRRFPQLKDFNFRVMRFTILVDLGFRFISTDDLITIFEKMKKFHFFNVFQLSCVHFEPCNRRFHILVSALMEKKQDYV